MKVSWSYTIDEELIEKIKKEAKRKNRSNSFIVNEILNKHFDKKEK